MEQTQGLGPCSMWEADKRRYCQKNLVGDFERIKRDVVMTFIGISRGRILAQKRKAGL